ncbi:hypothetical protein DIPPA_01129 [Diplonema papillatum]|nr:hypothetical protein DIPPA_01123 [Diplonema papillatum]KAJ9449677.1 hypothetical protein DIPPA_01131 [Diplonema papillatum]KAJ9449679.1 hypothetical protein DIPPA_01129 [Diplonema papillatum]
MKLVTASTMFVDVTAGTLGGFCVARSFFTDAAASAEGPNGSSSSTVDIVSCYVLSPTLARVDNYIKSNEC